MSVKEKIILGILFGSFLGLFFGVQIEESIYNGKLVKLYKKEVQLEVVEKTIVGRDTSYVIRTKDIKK